MRYKYLFFFTLLFIFNFSGYGQSIDAYSKEFITSKDGLPSNEIYQIIQDKNKYLWFTTDNGLVKFDGRNIKVFNSNNGLPNNTIFNLYEQPDGKIYGECHLGDFFYIENDSIIPYKYNYIINKHIPDANQCYSFYKDSLSNIHIGSRTGYIEINTKGEIINKDFGLLKNYKYTNLNIKKFPNYVLSYSTADSIDCNTIMEIINDKKQLIYSPKNENNFSEANYSAVIDEKTYAIIYLGSVFIIKNHVVSQKLKFHTRPISVSMTDSILWIGTADDGVYSYKKNKNNYELNDHFLDGHSVTSVLKDHENGFWFSTREQGVIHIYDFNVMKIYESKNYQNISTFYSDNVTKIVGFENGELFELNSKKTISSNNLKYPITEISNLLNNYLFFSRGETYEIRNHTIRKSQILEREKSEVASGVIKINDSIVAFYGISDILIYHRQKEQMLFHLKKDNIKARINKVTKLKNYLVIGTYRTVSFFDYENYLITQSINMPSPVASLMVYNDKLYIACRNGDLFVKGDSLTKVKLNSQSPINVINDAVINNDRMIIASNSGIYKYQFDTKNNTWKIDNFINLREINKIYVFQNNLYYATKKEIYQDQNLKRKNITPFFSAISFIANNNLILPSAPISLRYHENDVKFNLNTIAYNSKFLKFRYQLIGVDKTIKYTSESTINYHSLSPGTYQFKVSATANDIDYSDEQLISFTITPPFWLTSWFIAITLIFIICIITLLYFRQIRRIRAKLALKETIVHLKSKALVAQLNPHLVFNVLNSIQGIISEGELEKANKYLAQFSKFMRQSLVLSKKNNIGINEEIEITKNYISLEMIRYPKDLTINLNNELVNNNYSVPPLIIQPFIENAIKHGIMPSKEKIGIINISFKEKNNTLFICIEDNGVGFDKALNFNSGDGMRISKERLEVINPKNEVYLDVTKEKTAIVLKIYP